MSAEDFFADGAEVGGFAALYEILKPTPTDLKVYRCGEAHSMVYMMGRGAHGRLAGFKTHAEET
jgi:hypothetical protein